MIQKLRPLLSFELYIRLLRLKSDLTYPFRSFYRRLKNFLYWGWKMNDDINWDSSSLYYVLALKLKQLQFGCYENGNHVWSKKSREYKALKECQQLCEDLQESYNYNLNQIDFSKLGFSGGKFQNNMTPQEKKFLSLASQKDDEVQKNRKERLFFLLNRWSDFWWN